MTSHSQSPLPQPSMIGNADNFWLFDPSAGFDLTHVLPPSCNATRLMLRTTTSPIIIDPSKTALLVIDMQQFFLSSAFDRTRGTCHEVVDQLAEHAIPAARKADIRVIWVNWGISEDELSSLPPAVSRAHGFGMQVDGQEIAVDKHGKPRHPKTYKGLGSPCGIVSDPISGEQIDAGN